MWAWARHKRIKSNHWRVSKSFFEVLFFQDPRYRFAEIVNLNFRHNGYCHFNQALENTHWNIGLLVCIYDQFIIFLVNFENFVINSFLNLEPFWAEIDSGITLFRFIGKEHPLPFTWERVLDAPINLAK